MLAIALVLCAVFIPAALISGIQGQFYRQFAVTIAASTLISCMVSLTLSPALCALLLKPHEENPKKSAITAPIRWFFNGFNWLFDRLASGYGALTRRLIRLSVVVLVIYGGLIGLASISSSARPRLHPRAGPGLLHHGDPAAAGCLDGAYRQGGARSHQARALGRGHGPHGGASPGWMAPR